MRELTSKKTGKVHFVTDEIYKKLVETKAIRKYTVHEVRSLLTKPPQIIKPAAKVEVIKPEVVKKATKTK